jgi:hypothetical protein
MDIHTVVFILENFFGLLQSGSQLVRAGSSLHAAGRAFQAGNDFIHIHTLNQGGDTLQVAVAAADELDVLQLAVLDLKVDVLRAGLLSLIFELHG